MIAGHRPKVSLSRIKIIRSYLMQNSLFHSLIKADGHEDCILHINSIVRINPTKGYRLIFRFSLTGVFFLENLIPSHLASV